MAFLDEDFLLTNSTAKELYDACKDLPIIDYHCHLSPAEIASDENFRSIIDVWLGGTQADGTVYGDHYKWRLMRANGVPESHVTGDASDWDKFQAFAATMEKAIGNPVNLWTNLELRRIFGINKTLSTKNAREIYDECNEKLATPDFSRRSLIRHANVELVCTTDDPADDLHFHQELASEKAFRTVPAFRPDKALNIDKSTFGPWVERMEQLTGSSVTSFDALMSALDARVDYFTSLGGRLSDHAFDVARYETATSTELDAIVSAGRAGAALTDTQIAQYRTAVLLGLMKIYKNKHWTMQWHVNAARDINTTMFAKLGADTGYDAISQAQVSHVMAAFFDAAVKNDGLPNTIVYSLNPNDWIPLTATMGSFFGGGDGTLMLGNAWWFNDTYSGMREQITDVAQLSLLGNFIGMTTDSRSFLSYPRHEYFRRILCQLVGSWAEMGQITDDLYELSTLVRNISYTNAKDLFAA